MPELRCIIQVMGGLGNQLFQYALGRSLEIERGADVRYDLSQFDHPGERALSLRKYRTRLTETSRLDKIMLRLSMGRTLGALRPLLRLTPASSPWEIHNDPRDGFDPAVRELRGRWYLRGWWQCPAYFECIRDTLLDEIQPAEALAGANLQTKSRIDETNSVCVHVRRGDFVSSPVYRRILKTQPADYFLAAMTEMRRRVGDATFFVFSDDADWARSHITMDAPIVYVNHNDSQHDYLDMFLMSSCRHFITANSTFSWWAAWLSRDQGKIVIVPSVWGAQGGGPPPGLIPAHWQIGPGTQSAWKDGLQVSPADFASEARQSA
jgi:hypothetical protein